jgi:3-oxoacyl-[acyl-carrier protein] reductase
MTMKLTGKVILVTGASRGIGRSIALLCAEHGAQVVFHYNSYKQIAAAAFKNLKGNNHLLIQADLSQPKQAEKLVETSINKMGRIDVLVNNAGMFRAHPVQSTSFNDWVSAWNDIMAVNLFGAAHVLYGAARQMIEQGGGRIINISSRGAFRGEPESPAYGASKAGMNAMSQSMAKALAPYNILVFAVAPGFVETERIAKKTSGPVGEEIRKQSPFQRMASPEEVAQTVLFLASDAPTFMSGGIIDVNGASYLRS